MFDACWITRPSLLDGLMRYYSLEGNSRDSITGVLGTDSHVTYAAGNGKLGLGAGFAGDGGIIAPSLAKTTSYTVSMWIKPGAQTVTAIPITLGNPGGAGCFLLFYSGGASWIVSNGAAYLASVALPLNTWTHFAITNNEGTATVYVSGVVVAGPAGFLSTASSAPLWIGNYTPGNNPFVGAMDEVGVWNRALNTAEVAGLYNAGNGKIYPF